mmetsp:Transcript_12671/g.30825  ORF Transcript_12671/g.30825 Transcript_12671/m.30825 type:complete len:337 (+) Transcript_12671:1364-2374(+)|eukprot:g16031.t1
MADFDEAYVADCKVLQNGISRLQTATQDIRKELAFADSSSLLQTRSSIDAAIAHIAELQLVLKRLRAYTANAADPSEKHNKKQMYQQLSTKLQTAAKDLEAEIQQYIKACNVQRGGAGVAAGGSAGSSSNTGDGEQLQQAAGHSSSSASSNSHELRDFSDPLAPTTTNRPNNNLSSAFGGSSSSTSASSRSSTDPSRPASQHLQDGGGGGIFADMQDPFFIDNDPYKHQAQLGGVFGSQPREVTEADLEKGKLERMLSVQSRMEDLQSIYVDLSEHVSRASESFASIEAQVLRTAEYTHDAVNEIKITANRDFRALFRKAGVAVMFVLFVLWNLFF